MVSDAFAPRRTARRIRRWVHERRQVDGLPLVLVEGQREALGRRRSFGPADLEQLEDLLSRAAAVMPLRELAAIPPAGRTGRHLALRHDMDNDVENAVRMAEWESSRGFRATYFVLHSDWYYRAGTGGPPSRFVLGALDRIAGLGHEIGLHNNVVAVALRTGRDPAEVMATELAHLRRHGIPVVGTAAHGDRLCAVANFNNGEVFLDTPRPNLGPPDRTITCRDPGDEKLLEATLRPVAMASLGLRYEANFIDNRFYLSDSHGAWNRPLDEAAARLGAGDDFLQVLIHPSWWALQGEPVHPRAQ